MTKAHDPSPDPSSGGLIGAFRRFGAHGPVYEVIGPPKKPDDERMRIRVLLTGEELDYRLSEISSDPEG